MNAATVGRTDEERKAALASSGKDDDDLHLLARLLAGVPPSRRVDWMAITDLARRHYISPFLFWRLERLGEQWGREGAVSADVREALREDLYAAAGWAMLAEWQLTEVLRALDVAEVPALVIKGAALATFYPDPALRSYGDLDILVPQAHLPRAERALARLGYRSKRPMDWWLVHFHHLPVRKNATNSLAVELHWQLDHEEGLGCLPAKDLWSRAVSWLVGGQPALRLDEVDTALYLCRHAVVQHRAKLGLRPLCDLAQVTADWGQGQWEALARRASEYGLARSVYLMLVLMESATGLAAPAEVMSDLRPPASESLPADLVASFLQADGGPGVAVPVAVVQAGAKGTALARLRHVLWHLFLPRDGMAAVYNIPSHSPRIWLTYLRRPIDLLRRYGRSSWAALRRDEVARAAWAREVWLERWLRTEE